MSDHMNRHAERLSLTFGAVVLTLNATGCALLFVTVSVRLTSTVRGPAAIVSDSQAIRIAHEAHC